MAVLSATQSFAGWFSPFLGEWPVWGNFPSAFALAENGSNPPFVLDAALTTNVVEGLEAEL